MTPLHGIPKYNMSVVANSEKQAQVSFREIYEMIEGNDLYVTAERPNNPFYLSKVYVEGLSTKSQFLFDTSNEKQKMVHVKVAFSLMRFTDMRKIWLSILNEVV